MPRLPPTLRQRLSRATLLPGDALAVGGVGERRSRSKGEGIEFEDHRPYQFGDDLRRVDPHLFARFGEAFVRQYNVTQRLNVTLLLDASRSMASGVPSKMRMAARIAQGLAFVALAGSDLVQVGVLNGGRLHWRQGQSGLSRSSELEVWLDSWQGLGDTDLLALVNASRSRLQPGSLTIIISDFWSDSSLQAIDALAAAQQAIVAVHVLSPEEISPHLHGDGQLRLIDVESGEEVDVSIGAAELESYRALLADWTAELKARVFAARGRYLRALSDQPLEQLFLKSLPEAGVLR